MPFLAAVREQAGAEHGHALAALAAHAVIRDAIRAILAQRRGEVLAGSIVFVVIDKRIFGFSVAQIMQRRREIDEIDAHVELHAGLIRRAHEALSVVRRLGDSGAEVIGRVEHTVAAVGEAATFGIYMRERCHDYAGTGAADAILRRNKADVARLIPQSRIGKRFDFEDRCEIIGRRHPLEQRNRRKSARDNPPAWLPFDLDDGKVHAQPLRCASRY